MMWYIYIYIHTLCQKKKHKETKSYENIVYILLLYVYNLNFKCRKLEKKIKWLLSFFSNCDAFNYGFKITF